MPPPKEVKESKDQLSEALHLHIKKSQWGPAIETLQKLIALEPANVMYLLRTGDYYVKLGSKEKAIAAYMKAGEKFSVSGFLVKAIAAHKMALNLQPDHPEVRKKLERLHLEMKELTDPRMILSVPPPSGAVQKGAPAPTPEQIISKEQIQPMEVEQTSFAESAAPAPAPPPGQDGTLHLLERTAQPEGEKAAPPEALPIETTAFSAAEEGGSIQKMEVETTAFEPAAPPPPSETIPLEPTSVPPVEAPAGALDPDVEPTVQPVKHLNDVFPLFANLTPEEFSGVIEKTTARTYPPGGFVVREGESGDSIYIITKGQVKVTTRSGPKEIVLGTLGENDFFGEVAFLTGKPRTADVSAVVETDILELSGDALMELLTRYPRIHGVLQTLYVKRVKMTIEALKSAKGAL